MAPGFIGEYYEISAEDRKRGELSKAVLVPYQGPVGVNPACFRRAFDMLGALQALVQAGKGSHGGALELISEDRRCQEWYPYTPGLSPKEHFEEKRRLELEQERQGFEQRMENERRQFELTIFEMNKKLQEDTARVGYRLTVAAVIFAFAQVIAAVLALTSDSWLFHLLGRIGEAP